jgi:hypothetical protein
MPVRCYGILSFFSIQGRKLIHVNVLINIPAREEHAILRYSNYTSWSRSNDDKDAYIIPSPFALTPHFALTPQFHLFHHYAAIMLSLCAPPLIKVLLHGEKMHVKTITILKPSRPSGSHPCPIISPFL